MAGILQEDLVPSAPPFLIGRALWVTSRCDPGPRRPHQALPLWKLLAAAEVLACQPWWVA